MFSSSHWGNLQIKGENSVSYQALETKNSSTHVIDIWLEEEEMADCCMLEDCWKLEEDCWKLEDDCCMLEDCWKLEDCWMAEDCCC